MAPLFLLRYPYNRFKCIICNYINTDLFACLFHFRFQIFSNIVQFVWYCCVLVQTVIGI